MAVMKQTNFRCDYVEQFGVGALVIEISNLTAEQATAISAELRPHIVEAMVNCCANGGTVPFRLTDNPPKEPK